MITNKKHLDPKDLYKSLVKNQVSYFCGVPDSSLSSFSFYLEDHAKANHQIAVNEGSAVAMAIGYYLATQELSLVYMQNSGLGNAINPLVSFADPAVLGIPMILLIGWRGQPGKKDEPQHRKQGLITTKLLESLDIPYQVLSEDTVSVLGQVKQMAIVAHQLQKPVALIVENGLFKNYKRQSVKNRYKLSREQVIGEIVGSLSKPDIVVATTGKTSRELFELRENKRQHQHDLLVVGAMGHTSAIALAIAEQKSNRKIYCIDGDGALLMHMGSLATIGSKGIASLYHFVINNGSHESVGGQSTVGFNVDLPAIALACGYKHAYRVSNLKNLVTTLRKIKKLKGPILIEIRVNMDSRADLKRPTISPSKNKQDFISFLGNTK